MILKFYRKKFGDFKREFNINDEEEKFIKSLPGNENLDDNFIILYTTHDNKIYIASISKTIKLKNNIYRLKAGLSTDFWLDFSNSVSRNSFEVRIGKKFSRLVEARITGVYLIRFSKLEKYVEEGRVTVIPSDYEDGQVNIGIVDDFGNIIDSESIDKLIRMYYDDVELITIDSEVFNSYENNRAYLLKSSKIKIRDVQFSTKSVKVNTPTGDTLELEKIAVKIVVEVFGKEYESIFFVREGYVSNLLYNLKTDITDYKVKFDGFDEYAGVCTEYFTKYVLPLVSYSTRLKNDDIVRKWAINTSESLGSKIINGLVNGRLDENSIEELRSMINLLKELYYQEKLISEYVIGDVEKLLRSMISEKFEKIYRNMPDDIKERVLNARGNSEKLVEEFEYYFSNKNLPSRLKDTIEFDIGIVINDLVKLLLYNHIY